MSLVLIPSNMIRQLNFSVPLKACLGKDTENNSAAMASPIINSSRTNLKYFFGTLMYAGLRCGPQNLEAD